MLRTKYWVSSIPLWHNFLSRVGNQASVPTPLSEPPEGLGKSGLSWRQLHVEVQLSMTNNHINRVPSEVDAIKATAESDHDDPVLMLNLNRYTIVAAYPHGEAYQTYFTKIEESVSRVGGKLLWHTPVTGQTVGCEHDKVDEILAVWYPSHAAFLRL